MEIQWEAEKCAVISMISTVFKDAKVLGLPVTWRLHGNLQGHVLCSPAWGFVLGSRQVFPRSLLLGAWEPYCHDFMLVGRFIRSANITLVRSILH